MRRHSELNDEKVNNIEWMIKEITNIVEDVSGLEVSDPKAGFSEQGIDSMAVLDILTIIENRYHIVLNEELVREFTSITRIAHIVQQSLRNIKSALKTPIASL